MGGLTRAWGGTGVEKSPRQGEGVRLGISISVVIISNLTLHFPNAIFSFLRGSTSQVS